MYRNSLKQPKLVDASRKKNIETNALGEKRGRVHMAKQNLNTMALKNYKVKFNKFSKFNFREFLVRRKKLIVGILKKLKNLKEMVLILNPRKKGELKVIKKKKITQDPKVLKVLKVS